MQVNSLRSHHVSYVAKKQAKSCNIMRYSCKGVSTGCTTKLVKRCVKLFRVL